MKFFSTILKTDGFGSDVLDPVSSRRDNSL